MDWEAGSLNAKARLYGQRAHEQPIESALFGFWMSLCLELLARAALAKIHPVLLADPREEGNIHYAFGITPKGNVRSVQAKTVFARCSVQVQGFTDQMSAHCLILADRRNRELHTGAAAFESHDASTWLPQTYEVLQILLDHLGDNLVGLLGPEQAPVAQAMLKDRRGQIKKDVQNRIAVSRRAFETLDGEAKTTLASKGQEMIAGWVTKSPLRKIGKCPSCGFNAAILGESQSRGTIQINEEEGSITREVRVLPNGLVCPVCRLKLDGYQELLEGGHGQIFTTIETEDPIEFFGIIPEEHVDLDELMRQHQEYDNE